jgi:hypothetical protein
MKRQTKLDFESMWSASALLMPSGKPLDSKG